VSARRGNRWLMIASACALAALALMTWQIVDPTVWPVMVAMSLGQVLGTASFAAFGYVVVADFRARRRAESEKESGKVSST
jgi:MFS family permease